MRRFVLSAGLVLAVFGLPLLADDAKGTKVTLDDFSSTTPADWVKEKPASTLRFAQFKVPKAKGDKYDGLIVVFKGLGGKPDENVKRWKAEFVAPKGKTIADISKTTELKVAGNDATRLDIAGTCLYKADPKNFKAPAEKRDDYKMVAIQIEGPDNPYHIKFYAPAKTFDAQKKAFEDWVKGFKK